MPHKIPTLCHGDSLCRHYKTENYAAAEISGDIITIIACQRQCSKNVEEVLLHFKNIGTPAENDLEKVLEGVKSNIQACREYMNVTENTHKYEAGGSTYYAILS